jgi:hypothetical protein
MDPHKRSATIEVMAADETILGGGRYGTDSDGYDAMLRYARQWPNRVWAVEGCNGIGRHIANRLLADGEQVLDVPPKLSARARVFATGQGRKTDATDAHSVALVGTRMAGLRPVVNDEQLAVLRILIDRRRSLRLWPAALSRLVNRRRWAEIFPVTPGHDLALAPQPGRPQVHLHRPASARATVHGRFDQDADSPDGAGESDLGASADPGRVATPRICDRRLHSMGDPAHRRHRPRASPGGADLAAVPGRPGACHHRL